jgi:S-adenosylmethionine uptake transporter
MAATPSRLTALLLVASGIAALCVMDALMKWLALRHGTPLAAFGRYASGATIALIIWLMQGRPMLGAGGLRAHLLRGVLIVVMALCFFWSLTVLPLALTLTLTFVGPLMVPPLAALFLGEAMRPRVVVAGIAGFAGVLVAAGSLPDPGGRQGLAVAAAVLAALLYAGTLLILRARAAADGPTAITLVAAAIPALLLSPLVAVTGAAAPFGLPDLLLMLAAGLAGNIGVQLMARGYVQLEAQVSAVLEYSALPWAALLGWLVFDEAVAPATLAGAAIIAVACVWGTRPDKSAISSERPEPVP